MASEGKLAPVFAVGHLPPAGMVPSVATGRSLQLSPLGALHRSWTDLVVDQVDVVAGPAVEPGTRRRISVDRVPLPVNGGIRDARVAAEEARAAIVRAGGAEVHQGEIVEIEAAPGVDGQLGVAAAGAGVGLACLGSTGNDPL